jgi:predicted enzyme related to lactoylglutathione lyase
MREIKMNEGIKTILYPVNDVNRAKKLFNQLLDSKPHTDTPYYVGYKLGDQEIGLVPNGFSQGMTGPLGYYHVDDIRKSLQLIVSAGGKVLQEGRDVGGGKLAASVQDSEGNPIGLIQMP